MHAVAIAPVSDWFPHDTFVRLAVAGGGEPDASSWSTSVWDTPSADAVRVTDCVVVTAATVALKPTVLEPGGTVTEAGTCRELLLLASDTVTGLPAEPLRYTEHAFVAGPVSVWLPHDTLLRVTGFVVVVSGYNVITSVFVTPSDLPVMVTLTVFATGVETASNPVEVAPAAIVTADGTCSAELLLVKLTFVGFFVASLRLTEQVFD